MRTRRGTAGLALIAGVIAVASSVGAVASQNDVRITHMGVGEADITFHIGAGQGGWGSRWRVNHTQSQPIETNMYARLMKSTEGVHMKQRIKAFVFDTGERKLAILSNDLLGTVQMFHRAIADRVAEDPGIAWQDLMIVATHSEANPTNGTFSPLLTAYADVFDEEFAREVFDAATEAIRAAAADLEPVAFAAGHTEVDEVTNFVWKTQTQKPYVDRGLDVLRFDRLDGTTKALLVAYPGHFNLGGDPAVLTSSDGPGYVERMLEQRIEARQGTRPIVGYLPGTVGDSGIDEPRLRDLIYQETEASAIEISDGAMEVYDSLSPRPELVVNSVAERFPPPPDHQVPNFPLLGGAPIPFMVSHSLHVQVFQIGDVVFAGIPGEPVTELGWALRDRIAELGFARGIPLSHANDWTGYIYTAEQYDREEGRSDQGAYGRNQGWYLVDKALDLARVLLDPGYDYGAFDRTALMLTDDLYNSLGAWGLVTATPYTHEVRDAILLPNVVLECDGLAEPSDVPRFQRTEFAWRGGNNGADMPRVELQRRSDDGDWITVLDDEGYELHVWMKVYRVEPANPIVPGDPGCNELLDHTYSVVFEPAWDFPTGTYRFVSSGVFRTAPKVDQAYSATSDAFSVEDGSLTASVRVAGGDVLVNLAYPRDPDGIRFRPWGTLGGSAVIEVDGVPAGIATFDPARGVLALEGVHPPSGAEVTARGATDPWGNAAPPVSIVAP